MGKITPEDFPKIESEMQKIAKKAHPFQRIETPEPEKDENFLRGTSRSTAGNNKFKLEIVDDVLGAVTTLSFYKHGDFIDLCRGPHVPNTGFLKNVKLTTCRRRVLARRRRASEQLVRVYGTAFFSKDDLKDHLRMLEEAKKRDHRVLGEQLDLFSFNEDAPGFPFFHPRGATLFNTLQEYMRGACCAGGATKRSRPRSSCRSTCGISPGTTTIIWRTCSSRS